MDGAARRGTHGQGRAPGIRARCISGVSFDAEGNPVAPSRSEADQRFDSDGTPYRGGRHDDHLSTGACKALNADGELRVIFAIEEPRRVGFALGTVDGSS